MLTTLATTPHESLLTTSSSLKLPTNLRFQTIDIASTRRSDVANQVSETLDEVEALNQLPLVDRTGALLGITEEGMQTVNMREFRPGILIVPRNRFMGLIEEFKENNAALVNLNMICGHDKDTIRLNCTFPSVKHAEYLAHKYGAHAVVGSENEQGLFVPGHGLIYCSAAFPNVTTSPSSVSVMDQSRLWQYAVPGNVPEQQLPTDLLSPDSLRAARTTPVQHPGRGACSYVLFDMNPATDPTVLLEDLAQRMRAPNIAVAEYGGSLMLIDSAEQTAFSNVVNAQDMVNKGNAVGALNGKGSIALRGAFYTVKNLPQQRTINDWRKALTVPEGPRNFVTRSLNRALTDNPHDDAVEEVREKKFGTITTSGGYDTLYRVKEIHPHFEIDIGGCETLIGQEAQENLKKSVDAIKDPKVRLTIFIGEGGMGKSALINHTLRAAGKRAHIAPSFANNQALVGMGTLDFVNSVADQIQDEPALAKNHAALLQFAKMPLPWRRNMITDQRTAQKYHYMAQAAMRDLNIEVIGLEDAHHQGKSRPSTFKLMRGSLRTSPGCTLLVSGRGSDAEEVKDVDELARSVEAEYGPGSVVYFHITGVDFTNPLYARDFMRNECLGKHYPGQEFEIDDSYTEFARIADRSPLKFKHLVEAIFMDGGFVKEGSTVRIKPEARSMIGNMKDEGDYAHFLTSRVHTLHDPEVADSIHMKPIIECIALLGKIPQQQLIDIAKQYIGWSEPNVDERVTAVIQGLIDKKHLVATEDASTHEILYQLPHDMIGEILMKQMAPEQKMDLVGRLYGRLGSDVSVPVDSRYALLHHIAITQKLEGIPEGFVQEYIRVATDYLNDAEEKNATERTNGIAGMMLAVPFVSEAITAIENPHLQPGVKVHSTLVTFVTKVLLARSLAAPTLAHKDEADVALGHLTNFADRDPALLLEADPLFEQLESTLGTVPPTTAKRVLLLAQFRNVYLHVSADRAAKLKEIAPQLDAIYEELISQLSKQKSVLSAAGEPVSEILALTAHLTLERDLFTMQHLYRQIPRAPDVAAKEALYAQCHSIYSRNQKLLATYDAIWRKKHDDMPCPLVHKIHLFGGVAVPFEEIKTAISTPENPGHGVDYDGNPTVHRWDLTESERPNVVRPEHIKPLVGVRDTLDKTFKLLEQHPTLLDGQFELMLYGAAGPVHIYMGDYDAAREVLTRGYGVALSLSSYGEAVRLLKLRTDLERMDATTTLERKPSVAYPGKMSFRPDAHIDIRQLESAYKVLDKEGRHVLANIPPNSIWHYIMKGTDLEMTGDIARYYSPDLIRRIVGVALGQSMNATKGQVAEAQKTIAHLATEVAPQCLEQGIRTFYGINEQFARDAIESASKPDTAAPNIGEMAYDFLPNVVPLLESAIELNKLRDNTGKPLCTLPVPENVFDGRWLPTFTSYIATQGILFGNKFFQAGGLVFTRKMRALDTLFVRCPTWHQAVRKEDSKAPSRQEVNDSELDPEAGTMIMDYPDVRREPSEE